MINLWKKTKKWVKIAVLSVAITLGGLLGIDTSTQQQELDNLLQSESQYIVDDGKIIHNSLTGNNSTGEIELED